MPTPAGWLPDPSGDHELRYWDGAQWTDHVAKDGARTRDPFVKADPPPLPEQAPEHQDRASGPSSTAAGTRRRHFTLLGAGIAAFVIVVAIVVVVLAAGGTDDVVLRGTVETENFSRRNWSGIGGDPCPAAGAEIRATESHSERVISSSELNSPGTILGDEETWTSADEALCRFRFELPLPDRPEYDIYVESKRDGLWRVTLTSLERRDFRITLVDRD